jgi:UDP-3-O-[3-hydroxymyristoyl] glucosamine N-acyltransferase
MSTRLGDLVKSLGGELIGDPDVVVTGIAPLEAAGESHITFLSNTKLRTQAAATRAAALILAPGELDSIRSGFQGACILTDNPYAYYAHAAQYFVSLKAQPSSPGIHATAVVSSSAQVASTASVGPQVVIEAGALVGEHCVIGAGCYIGHEARVGEATVLHPNVTLLSNCHIGARGVVNSGAVIGGDGFGFANQKGRWIKIPQTGGVRIGDDVEIGANTTIDRGALEHTVIANGVKLDNQIQIAHNCIIGENTAMAGCVGVAGSAKIGRNCTFGGAAMVLGHLTIADNVHVSSGSLVSRSINEPGQYTGFYPLAKNSDWEKTAAVVRQLDSMRDRVRELEKLVKELTLKK